MCETVCTRGAVAVAVEQYLTATRMCCRRTDFARLGWVPGLICLAWFAAAGVYSGFLYQVYMQKLSSTSAPIFVLRQSCTQLHAQHATLTSRPYCSCPLCTTRPLP